MLITAHEQVPVVAAFVVIQHRGALTLNPLVTVTLVGSGRLTYT